jgi:molybdopterin converting factor small subunit
VALTILFFAQCASWAGRKQLEIPVESPVPLDVLIAQRTELQFLKDHRASLRVAVNREFSDFNREVRNGDEIAFMSPFSGG